MTEAKKTVIVAPTGPCGCGPCGIPVEEMPNGYGGEGTVACAACGLAWLASPEQLELAWKSLRQYERQIEQEQKEAEKNRKAKALQAKYLEAMTRKNA